MAGIQFPFPYYRRIRFPFEARGMIYNMKVLPQKISMMLRAHNITSDTPVSKKISPSAAFKLYLRNNAAKLTKDTIARPKSTAMRLGAQIAEKTALVSSVRIASLQEAVMRMTGLVRPEDDVRIRDIDGRKLSEIDPLTINGMFVEPRKFSLIPAMLAKTTRGTKRSCLKNDAMELGISHFALTLGEMDDMRIRDYDPLTLHEM